MKMNIFELHERFCSEAQVIRNLSRSTLRWYRYTIKHYTDSSNAKTIDQITSQNLMRFLYDGRVQKNWTADTFLNYYKGLKSFLKWCVNNEFLEVNPILKIEKPKLEKKLPKRITKQEALRLIEFSFNSKYCYRHEAYRNRAIIATMIFAGLRAKEVLDLKMADIDLLNSVISVNLGKGGKDRVVPISSTLRRYYSEFLKDRERIHRNGVNFFTSIHGDFPFTYSGLKTLANKLKVASGVDFSPHKLRHTFATLMLEGGCDIYSLSKMLGHSDIKTTTIYLSASISHLQEQILKHPLN